jgi:hypothetical protein
MRLGRKPAEAPRIDPIADDGSIPLIDVRGQGFDLLRSIDLGRRLSAAPGAAAAGAASAAGRS